MQIIRFAGCKVTPWKNGGGVTTELATDPPGAALDGFNWRLSLARIERSGPFSRYPGIDRTLAVIGGSNVTLHIEDRAPLLCVAGSGFARFPGELNVNAEVGGKGSEDFNVMSRRGYWKHSIMRIELFAPTTIERSTDVLVLCQVAGSPVTIDAGESGSVALQRRDALLLDDADVRACKAIPARRATLFVVRLTRI